MFVTSLLSLCSKHKLLQVILPVVNNSHSAISSFLVAILAEDALRLGRGRLDGLGLFDGKQVTSLMIEGVQNHVRISLADKW